MADRSVPTEEVVVTCPAPDCDARVTVELPRLAQENGSVWLTGTVRCPDCGDDVQASLRLQALS
jgi:hypothetical protein